MLAEETMRHLPISALVLHVGFGAPKVDALKTAAP